MQSSKGKIEKNNLKIIFEDGHLLIIEKPSGIVVNDSQTTTHLLTLQNMLVKENYPLAKDRERRSGIVHRLDKETSGIMIVAKTKDSFENLQAQFKERKVKKTYLALLHGRLKEKKGTISLPVNRLPWNRKRFGVLPGGRDSLTDYIVLSEYEKDKESFSLVEFHPKTGRTHQIRIHAKYLNHPIVSDSLYAGRKTSRKDRIWCPRLFLHAAKISFFHPVTNKALVFKSELPDDLTASLNLLEKSLN